MSTRCDSDGRANSRSSGLSLPSSMSCLSSPRLRPECSFRSLRISAEFMRHHGRSPLTSFATVRRYLIGRQHGGANTGSGCRSRHAPHHARNFVLGDHAAARLGYGAGAGRAVAAHARKHDAERGGTECRRRRSKRAGRRRGGRNSPAVRCRYAGKALLAARPSYDDCQAPHRLPRASAARHPCPHALHARSPAPTARRAPW